MRPVTTSLVQLHVDKQGRRARITAITRNVEGSWRFGVWTWESDRVALPVENIPIMPLSIPEWVGRDDQIRDGKSAFYRFSSTDIDAVRDRMCRLFRPHVIRPRDRAREPRLFELDELAVGADLALTRVRYNREVTIEAPPLDEFFVLQFTLSGACETIQGNRCTHASPGKLCVLNATRPIRQDMDAAYSQLAVKISTALLGRHLAAQIGHELPHELEFVEDAQPLTGPLAGMARMLSTIWTDLSMGTAAYHQHAVQHALQQTVAAFLLSAFPHNYSQQLSRGGEMPAPHFVRRAERFIRQHASSPIGLADILLAAGVSQRTLQTGFRQFRSTTPMAYLKTVRLDLARKALLDSATTRKTVTEIAFDCGFGHLSKFAQDYKACYGETPSATARRSHV